MDRYKMCGKQSEKLVKIAEEKISFDVERKKCFIYNGISTCGNFYTTPFLLALSSS